MKNIWNEELILTALKKHLDRYDTLKNICKFDKKLDSAIRKRQGHRYFLEKLGYKEEEIERLMFVEKGIQTDEELILELKEFIKEYKTLDNLKKDKPNLHFKLKYDKNTQNTKIINLINYLDKIYSPKFDYSFLFFKSKIPNGFWTELRIISKLQEMMVQDGIIKLGKSTSLCSAIQNQKGFAYYLEKMGLTYEEACNVKEPNYWSNWDNMKKELDAVIKECNGAFPNEKILRSYGIHNVYFKYFGGIEEVRQRMGFQNQYKALDGHVLKSAYEVIVDNFLFLNKIPHKYEGKFSEERLFLYDFYLYIDNVYVEIWGLDDGDNERSNSYRKVQQEKKDIYSKLKLELIEIFPTDLNNYNKIIPILNNKFSKFIDKEYGVSDEELIIPDYRITLENLKEKLSSYMPNNNTLPSETDLINVKRQDIVGFIKKYGGMTCVAERLGLQTKCNFLGQYPNGYWTIEVINDKLTTLYKQYGYVPNYWFIRDELDRSLASAIDVKGGYRKITKNLGLITESEYKKAERAITKEKDNLQYVKDICAKLNAEYGYIPKEDTLRSLGFSVFVSRIKSLKGLTNTIIELGYIPEVQYKKHLKKVESNTI